MSLEPAGQAPVHDRVLALCARERTDGRHRSAAVARAVAGRLPVDVARVQALRTVIAVPPPIQRPPYKRAAVTAAKLLARSMEAARAPLISKRLRHGVLRLSRRPRSSPAWRPGGHVAIRLTMSRARTMGVGMLQLLLSVLNRTKRNGHRTASCDRLRSAISAERRQRKAGASASTRTQTDHRRRCVHGLSGVLGKGGTSERIQQGTQRLRPSWQ
jgi:hypothetical protein